MRTGKIPYWGSFDTSESCRKYDFVRSQKVKFPGLILKDECTHALLQTGQKSPLKGHNYEFLDIIFQNFRQSQCCTPETAYGFEGFNRA